MISHKQEFVPLREHISLPPLDRYCTPPLQAGAGLDDLRVCFPTSVILWLYDILHIFWQNTNSGM